MFNDSCPQGVPGYSHTFRTTSTQLKTTAYNGVRTTSFQSLLATQPADPTTTYKGLIQNGVSFKEGESVLPSRADAIGDDCSGFLLTVKPDAAVSLAVSRCSPPTFNVSVLTSA